MSATTHKDSSLNQKIEANNHSRLSKTAPIAEPFLNYINEVLPLIDYFYYSMGELTRHMPTAINRLKEANQTSENAIQKIMDEVEHIFDALDKLENLAEPPNASNPSFSLVQQLQEYTVTIVNALQFQDITYQKLASVERILQAIQKQFSLLKEKMDRLQLKNELKKYIEEKKSKTSPPELNSIKQASQDIIRLTGIDQKDVDSLFKKHSG